jgi:Fe-S-cluster containining protein
VIAICNGCCCRSFDSIPFPLISRLVAKANSDIQLTATIYENWKADDMKIEVIAYREDGKRVVQGAYYDLGNGKEIGIPKSI